MKKLLTLVLALALLLSAVACVKKAPEEKSEEPQKTVEEIYAEIVAEYTELLTIRHNGEELPPLDTGDMDEPERQIAVAIYNIALRCDPPQQAEYFGYAYKDVDGNGVSELLLMTKTTLFAIFTVSEGKAILLEAAYGYPDSSLYLVSENHLLLTRSSFNDQIQDATTHVCHVEGTQMVYDTIYGAIYDQEKKEVLEYYQILNGEQVSIDEETYNELNWDLYLMQSSMGDSAEMKLNLPYVHLLFGATDNSEKPTVDFSSYEAILDTYQKIEAAVPNDYNYYRWIHGEYDDLFSYPNEQAFEYFQKLFYVARRCKEPGYDLIDLNGDGLDELVLLGANYVVRAIFTQKDGVPVLLDQIDSTTYWLDAEGRIHADREKNYSEYSLYEVTSDGGFALRDSISQTNLGCYRLTADGKTEKISREEFSALYQDYTCYPETFTREEYTKNVSELTFTPIVQPTDADIQTALGKTWSYYFREEEATGLTSAHSNLYITFENLTDTQVDVNFKYTFTYYVRNPDTGYYEPVTDTESFLTVTARRENNTLIFEGNGIKGKIELNTNYAWLFIEESTDERFKLGWFCSDQLIGDTIE